ncbi:hypothetical protein DSM104299_00940 [Baekduia alba]|uniref:hypothetical protein n=1 Tax=Baekduia alba TaxID=2997333 RepID=UPI0023421331|nr:hypothetical protein [Baekduia alba]WCB92250.1 hypothetical protein DSM104299_00940 [Baekduia alba]
MFVFAWLFGTVAAAIVFLAQLRSYRKKALPIALPIAIWLGVGQIAILFGNLMVSFGAPDIADEFGLPAWLVVVINHAGNFGGFVGCLVAALWIGLPRRMPVILGLAGVSIAVSPFMGGAFVPAASLSLLVFGALAAWAVFNVHVRVLAAVPKDRRAETMGLILSPCLLVGVALVGVPLLGGWHLGLWTIAVVVVLLAVTYPLLKGVPKATRLERHGFDSMLGLAKEHRRLIVGVCANFSGWVALYTIPSLAGASSDGIELMAVAGQLVAAGLAPLVGRLADLNPRKVGYAAACGLAVALVGTAVAPTGSLPLLAVPLLGLKLGWWLCALFFAVGEACGNFNQGLMEAAVSRVNSDSVRVQLIALAPRFAVVALLNITLAIVSAVVGGAMVGMIIGGVCTAVVLGGLVPALRKMPAVGTA